MNKIYVAIGHWVGSSNTTSVILIAKNKKESIMNCRINAFAPYVVITMPMLEKIRKGNTNDIYKQVCKLTKNFRVWNKVTKYIEESLEFIERQITEANKHINDQTEIDRRNIYDSTGRSMDKELMP